MIAERTVKNMFENEKNIFDNDLVLDLKNENGNSVIEASVVVTITLFMLATIIMLGFYHYQVTLLQTVADEIATNIARTYPYKSKDPISGFIGSENLADRNIVDSSYWILGDINWGHGSKNQNEENEAKSLAERFLSGRRFISAQGKATIEVEIQKSEVVLFQNEINVTVSENYYIPFAQFLGVKKSLLSVKKSSKAICYDVVGASGYYRTLMTFAEAFGGSEAGKLVKNLTSIVDAVITGGKNIISFIFKKG